MNATAATDLVLAAAALVMTVDMARRRPRHWPIWTAGFAAACAAAGAGTAFHSGTRSGALWTVIVALIALSAVCIAVAAWADGLPRGAPRTRWAIAGGLVTAAAVAVQRSPLAGHNVIYHLAQIAGLYAFYRAGTTRL